MLPSIPDIRDYDISPENGFLPSQPPLEILPDPYYAKWESIVANLQGLLLTKRLRGVVDRLPTLSTDRLCTEEEWRRAHQVLAFLVHGYIWGGIRPADRVPPCISIPFLETCEHLELPPVATYAAVVLWNFKPLFLDEPFDSLENLATLNTFTGSLDESWFFLVSAAIEARGAPIIPEMLTAIAAARRGDSATVTANLHSFAERLDELGALLQQMYDNCDPRVFYHRIRPFLAGSKNMADAGLPNGVIFDDGTGNANYVQYSGGSNAQSSLIQFFDIALGIEHRPTGEKRTEGSESDGSSGNRPSSHNFIQEMRKYMPGPHRRFLERVSDVANIREYVESHKSDRALCIAYDACLAMLRSFRDKHIQIVSRYIIIQSRESRSHSRSISPKVTRTVNIASAAHSAQDGRSTNRKLHGTGGTALIPFLKQARDETGEPAIDAWARRLLSNGPADNSAFATLNKMGEHADGAIEIVGLAGTWAMDDSEGGICHW
ncbi:Indoleamine 2,3-dioxygenase subfamily [Xylona heveae TC161]|uniref:Indoleamine 2,3-dioxygenase n=1 Tax=Xylona heveae (strain CBS 132557 / TC161) TaxID=1328760 RepID=A0A165HJN8_XYLHT|nr:Indoleamine 2,3-dioxygenase subfamily [Xylona heveae TC161]KZF23614.1 Indoleamine 2,3-dioxygenase subfamily [Xylona heveae TC161]